MAITSGKYIVSNMSIFTQRGKPYVSVSRQNYEPWTRVILLLDSGHTTLRLNSCICTNTVRA